MALRNQIWPCQINFWLREIVFGLARSIFGLAKSCLALRDRLLPCKKTHGLAKRPIALREGMYVGILNGNVIIRALFFLGDNFKCKCLHVTLSVSKQQWYFVAKIARKNCSSNQETFEI